MSFRPLRDGEEEDLIALWRACDLTRPWNDPRRDIAFARGKPNSEVLVKADESGIVAAIMAGHDGHRGMFYYLAVRPDRRGEGLGRAAVRAAEEWLAGRGVWKINILVRAENAAVRGFYEALGYEINEVFSMGRRIEPPA
jgi:ribosomal protein S18 acetylase RimI-like enzyme